MAEQYAIAELEMAVRAVEDQTIDLLEELASYTKTYPKDIVALMAEEMDVDEFMDWMAQLPDEVVLDNADDIKRIFGNMELYEKFKEENK